MPSGTQHCLYVHLIILILLAFVLVAAVGSHMKPILRAGRRKREKLPMTAIFFFFNIVKSFPETLPASFHFHHMTSLNSEGERK